MISISSSFSHTQCAQITSGPKNPIESKYSNGLNPFSAETNAGNRKFLLFETDKHTKYNSYRAIEIGITFARDIVEHYMPGILIEWKKIYEPRRPGECLYFYIDSKYSRTFRIIENCEISI